MVNGPLWFSLVCVSLIFRLIMDVKDVGGECIEYEYFLFDFGYVKMFLLRFEDALASMAVAIW